MDGYFRQPSKCTKLKIQRLFRLFVKKSQKFKDDFIDSIEEWSCSAAFCCITFHSFPKFYPFPVGRPFSVGILREDWADTYKNSTSQKRSIPSALVSFHPKQPRRETASGILPALFFRPSDSAAHFLRTSSRSTGLKRQTIPSQLPGILLHRCQKHLKKQQSSIWLRPVRCPAPPSAELLRPSSYTLPVCPALLRQHPTILPRQVKQLAKRHG